MNRQKDDRLTVPVGNGFIVGAQDSRRMLSVAQMCKLTGVTRKTLYYYDKIDLLKPMERRGSQSSKFYDESALEVLRKIRTCQKAGLRLQEIKQFLNEDHKGQIALVLHVLERMRQESMQLEEQRKQADALLKSMEGVEEDVL